MDDYRYSLSVCLSVQYIVCLLYMGDFIGGWFNTFRLFGTFNGYNIVAVGSSCYNWARDCIRNQLVFYYTYITKNCTSEVVVMLNSCQPVSLVPPTPLLRVW